MGSFPEIDYFRLPEVADKMTNLLCDLDFLSSPITLLIVLIAQLHILQTGARDRLPTRCAHTSRNREVQCTRTSVLMTRLIFTGMHELLAPLLWVVDYDTLSPSPSLDSLPHLVLARDYIEHDTWSLFSALMRPARSLYDHTPSVPLPIDRTAASSTTNLTLNHAGGPSATIVLVQPIVGTAIRIHDRLLQTIDPALWAKMEKVRVEPQLYAIRWLRLLFSREFPINDTLQLWDGLFAEDPSLRLIEYICIAMLLRIRDPLLASDYTGFLQLLLRYPSPADGDNRVSLLVHQAILLRDNVSESAGEKCRVQNIAMGAVAGVASGEDDSEGEDERGYRRQHPSAQRLARLPNGGPQVGTAAALLAEGGGIVGDIAKGMYDRAEALGLNKALFGTFSEIRVRPRPLPTIVNSFPG